MDDARGCKPGAKGYEHPVKLGQALEIFDRCPKAWLREEGSGVYQGVCDAMFFDVHRVPPCSGGLLDQPSKFIDTLNIVTKVRSRAVE